MLLHSALAFAARMVSLTAPGLTAIAALAAVACGSDAAPERAEEDDDSAAGEQDGGSDDDGDEPRPPAKGDGSVGSRSDGGRGPAPGKHDASSAEEREAGAEQTPEAASAAGKDGAVDAGRTSADRDAAAEGKDAAQSPTPADAGSGPTQPPVGGSDDRTIPMTIPTPSNGAGEIRPSTTVLKNAQSGGKDVWDFENKKIGVNNPVACEGSEGQLTVFEVEDGVTVRNLIIAGGRPGGNGIVCKGSCTLDHVYWEDVCEDAATNSKDGATMILDHVVALNASDKMFQHNAKGGSKTIIRNSYVADFGKLWRSCGDCDNNGGPRHLEIENVRVDRIRTTVAGANRNYGDTVTVKELFVKGGYDANQDKPKICQEYIGVTDHQGESTKVNDGKSQWNTSTCKLTRSDVKAF